MSRRTTVGNGLARVHLAIGTASAWGAGLAFFAIFCVNLAQIATRALGGGLVWVPDLSQLLFLWTVMLGTVAAYCRGEHVVTGLMDGRLRGKAEVAFLAAVRAIEFAFFAILVVAGAHVTGVRGSISYVQLGGPTSWAYAAIPVAALLMAIVAVILPLRPTQPDSDVGAPVMETA
jgi:TRAP-type C4-dicarboxylate transport system permease small subunit